MSRPTARETVRSAEPKGIGSASARDPLAREVKLVGALLGQVIVEQEGVERFELVEHLRRAAIRRRTGDAPPAPFDEAHETFASQSLPDLLAVARAFTAYFLLINLAEEKHRVRMLRRRERAGTLPESIADAVGELARTELSTAELRSLLDRLLLRPVLTAHPTEARRRTVLVAQRRLYRLLDRFDDPRLTRRQDSDLRRRLREEITVLWQTSTGRRQRPTPLDEVRAAMVFFDQTLFRVTPQLYRALDTALLDRRGADGRSGAREPAARPFLRVGLAGSAATVTAIRASPPMSRGPRSASRPTTSSTATATSPIGSCRRSPSRMTGSRCRPRSRAPSVAGRPRSRSCGPISNVASPGSRTARRSASSASGSTGPGAG